MIRSGIGLLCLSLLMNQACKAGGDASADNPETTPPTDSKPSDSESFLTGCPAASTLIETTEWTSCLEGKSLTGQEPFSNKPCKLIIKANGAFDYELDGALMMSVPDRTSWKSPTGTYQNKGTGISRIFLAGLAPNLPAVPGQARVTNVDISIFGLSTQQDKVEVRYLDAALARQTYNCHVSVP